MNSPSPIVKGNAIPKEERSSLLDNDKTTFGGMKKI